MLARPFRSFTASTTLRSEFLAPRVLTGVPKLPHTSFVAAVQAVGAAASAITALIGLFIAVRNLPRLSIWWKSRREIVAANESLSSQLKAMTVTAALSHQAALDVKMSVDSLRSSNEEMLERVATLEQRSPVYDAAMEYIPSMLEYVVWLESVAKESALDLGGREMPVLPSIIVDYLQRNGRSAR